MFRLWNQTSNDARILLSPDLGLRDWNALSETEKEKIWHHLKGWFLGEKSEFRVLLSIFSLNELHKFHSYAEHSLKNSDIDSAYLDFKSIFYNQHKHVVLQMMSCFCQSILDENMNRTGRPHQGSDEPEAEYKKRLTDWQYEILDSFAERLNDVFEQFGINVVLTRTAFIVRQDPKITTDIYIPVLNSLSDSKWKDVEREIRDAFQEYQQNTEYGYSNCITHAISALEAFLQILVEGKTGSSAGLSALITHGKEKRLLPSDEFSDKVIKGIGDVLLRERGKTGDGHPKKEYATEKSTRLVLNLVMVFMQHCLQK